MPQAAESSLLKVECQVELSSYILTLFESALRIWLVWVTGSPGDQLRSHWQETANSLPGWQQLDWSCLCLLPVFCPAASLLKLEARTSPLIWQSVGDSSNLNSSSSSYPINHDEYEYQWNASMLQLLSAMPGYKQQLKCQRGHLTVPSKPTACPWSHLVKQAPSDTGSILHYMQWDKVDKPRTRNLLSYTDLWAIQLSESFSLIIQLWFQ